MVDDRGKIPIPLHFFDHISNLILYTSNSRTWEVLHKTRPKKQGTEVSQSGATWQHYNCYTTTGLADLRNTFHWDRPSQTIVNFWSTSTFVFAISSPRNHLLPD